MSRYWSDMSNYAQPDASKLKKNAAASKKKAGQKGKVLNPVVVEGREIGFDCSCPDWALMCKHVAAVLYGVGVRLDEQPLLFFTLRGIDFEHFIDVALENKVEQMLENAGNIDKNHSRILDFDARKALFGDLI